MSRPQSWATIKRRIFERDDWTCGLCREPIDRTLPYTNPMSGQIDHIVSVRDGGSDHALNLQATHRVCNARKGPSHRRPGPLAVAPVTIGYFNGVPNVDLTPRLAAAVAELASAIVEQVVAALDGVPGPDRLLSLVEAAERLGIGRSAIYAEVNSCRLLSLKVGSRRLVPETAIAAYISARTAGVA